WSAVRANTTATGFSPFLQYRQAFLPASSPVTLSGWNGPGTFSPVCGPLLISAANATPPSTTTAAAANRFRVMNKPPGRETRSAGTGPALGRRGSVPRYSRSVGARGRRSPGSIPPLTRHLSRPRLDSANPERERRGWRTPSASAGVDATPALALGVRRLPAVFHGRGLLLQPIRHRVRRLVRKRLVGQRLEERHQLVDLGRPQVARLA